MKVTQKEFDAKRKELSDVQDDLHVEKSQFKGLQSLTESIYRSKNKIDDKIVDLTINELKLKSWLEDVWIEEDLSVDLTGVKIQSSEDDPYIAVRSYEEYKNKAYHLSNVFDWKLEVDSNGSTVLIPTKKPKKPYKPNKP